MGVSRDDSPVPMSLEDVLRIRVKQLVWLDEAGEPEPLNELVRRLAKELITDELRRKTGLNGAKRMQELAAELPAAFAQKQKGQLPGAPPNDSALRIGHARQRRRQPRVSDRRGRRRR
jgi:hypothetical protein